MQSVLKFLFNMVTSSAFFFFFIVSENSEEMVPWAPFYIATCALENSLFILQRILSEQKVLLQALSDITFGQYFLRPPFQLLMASTTQDKVLPLYLPQHGCFQEILDQTWNFLREDATVFQLKKTLVLFFHCLKQGLEASQISEIIPLLPVSINIRDFKLFQLS